MTTIVGVVHDGAVWIGADSCGSRDTLVHTRGVPKIWTHKMGLRADGLIVAGCGSARILQVARYDMNVPSMRRDIVEWAVRDYVPALHEALRRIDGENVMYNTNSILMIGYRRSLLTVDMDYNIDMPAEGYASYGSGCELALGSLYSTTTYIPELEPRLHIMAALHAASRHDAHTAPPFTILTTDPDDDTCSA